MVAWLSSIKDKNLNGCGKLVLTGDMSELSITKVDLRNMNTLEGKLSCCLIGGEASWQHCYKYTLVTPAPPAASQLNITVHFSR